jgi:molecular chaperone HtpG
MPETETAAAGETRPFGAEVARLLHLMVHSVYTDRDIFLRELISNAADACERLRTLALDRPELLAADSAFRIVLVPDRTAGTLAVEDNGIGMDRQEMIDNLGTIARSGTRAFVESLRPGEGAGLIGQFGVGFYSAFMVASTVEVVSRPAARPGEAWRWRSDGKGDFTVEPADPANAPARGTRVVLKLTDEARQYAEEATLERVVATWSAHVPVPIRLRLGGGAVEKTLADGTALWRKPRAEATPAQYAEAYRQLSGNFDEPALTLHYRAEGRHEYAALLFVPSQKPFDLFDPERRTRVKLYVRRVFITDEAPLLPAWLRFVRGVIDSEDLPLNISREMLQKNPLVEQIGKAVANRLLSELEKLSADDSAKFATLWEAFGAVLKEGLYEAPERRDQLFRIARFRSTAGTGWRSLADYVKDLRPNQTRIYYLLGSDEAAARSSPHLEGFRKRGVEVLVLTDPVDAFWVRTAVGYEGKPFQSVTQGGDDLSAIPLAGEEPPPDAAADSAVATLAARFRTTLGDRVSAVRASNRLSDSAVCLVAPELGPDRELERILARHRPLDKRVAPVLELNPVHPLIKALAAKAVAGEAQAVLDDAAILLFGQACILDGEPPGDPADFGARIARLLNERLG